MFGGSLASQKVEVERFRLRNEFVDRVIDLLSRIKASAMRPDSVENALDVPRYSGKAVVKMAERPVRECTSVAPEESSGEFIVLSGVDRTECHELRTLVERTLGRNKHGVHHVLSGAGEDEVRIRHELDVASQKRLGSLLRELANLLELVDRDRYLASARRDVVKGVLQRCLGLRRREVEGKCEGSVILRSQRRAAAPEEREQLSSDTLGRGVESVEDCSGERLHKRRKVFDREYVEIDRRMGLFEDAEGVVDETCLAVASRRDECHIPAV